jgi:integrase
MGLLFEASFGAGNPENLANIKIRFWYPLQVRCGITMMRRNKTGELVARPRYGLHVTRHFYASWLIRQGVPPKRVQALMGHATIKLTLDTYGHLWPDDADDAKLEAAEAALLSPVIELDATKMQQCSISD